MIAIPPRLRRPLALAGYPAFALAVALVTLFATLPRDRIKDKLESTLSADPMSGAPGATGMDVSIGDLGLTLFTGAGVSLTNVVLRTRPVRPDQKPQRYVIDDATLHVGLLGLLFNRPGYSFKVHLFDGILRGSLDMSPSEQDIEISAKEIHLEKAQVLKALLGLPVTGTLSGKIDAVAPKNLAANLNGTVELAIDDATIGDNQAKLVLAGVPFLSEGVTVPKLRLGRVAGKLVMEKGHARIEDLAAHSPDLDITLDGYVQLHDPLSMSEIHGYLKFRPSEALVKREPTIALVTGALSSAKRPDGWYGFQMSGPLMSIFFLPNVNPPPGVIVRSGPSLPPTVPSRPFHPPPAAGLTPPAVAPPPPAEPAPDPAPADPPPERAEPRDEPAHEPPRDPPHEPSRESPTMAAPPMNGRNMMRELHPPPAGDPPPEAPKGE